MYPDGTVWDNYTAWEDNFGEISIGKSGVKIINEYTLAEKWDDNVVKKLENASLELNKYKGKKIFNSFNGGGEFSLTINEYSVSGNAGIFSTDEHTAGLYYNLSFSIEAKLDKSKGTNVFSYLPKGKLGIFGQLNTNKSFKANLFDIKSDLKSSKKESFSLNPIAPATPFVKTSTSLNTGKKNTSTGISIGSSVSAKSESKMSYSKTISGATSEINLE